MRSATIITGFCVFVVAFSIMVYEKYAISANDNAPLLSFLGASTDNNIIWLKEITVHSTVKQMNNFKISKRLQDLSKSHPILYTVFDLKEEVSLDGYVRREGTSLTKYAASATAEDLSNSDNSHAQTEQWIHIHTPSLLVRLADPNAIGKRNHPQWVVESNTSSNPLLYDTRSAIYWLAAPIQSNNKSLLAIVENMQSSNLDTYSNVVVSSIDPNVIVCEFGFNSAKEGYQKSNIFTACFFAEEPGKWLEIIYYTPMQTITQYMKCTYNEEKIPSRVQIFNFNPQEAYTGDIDLIRMAEQCEIYYDISIHEFRETKSFPLGYFDYLSQMEDHHYVSDHITNTFYKVSEPDKAKPLNEIQPAETFSAPKPEL